MITALAETGRKVGITANSHKVIRNLLDKVVNRINRLAIVQEHRMILRVIELGVSENRHAVVLNVNLDHIRRKRRLLDFICSEAAALFEDKHISINSFA